MHDATTCSTGGTVSNLTMGDIRRAMGTLLKYRPEYVPFVLPASLGLNVLETPARLVQKVKMNDTFPHSDKALDDMNAWLLARFGTRDESLVPRGTALRFGNTIVMRPEDVVRLGDMV